MNEITQEQNIINIADLKRFLIKNDISNSYYNNLNNCLGQNPKLDFTILFEDYKLHLKKPLRIIPGRRLVFYSELLHNNQIKKVVVKLFINNLKYLRDFNAYLNGYSLLIDNDIKTSKVLISNKYDDLKLSLIVSEYIENTSGINTRLEYNQLINSIADLHSKNLYQKDLHLGNFIINTKGEIYCLDCESIKPSNDLTIIHRNFSLFLAQLDIDMHEHWAEYAKLYLEMSNQEVKNSDKNKKFVDNILEAASNIFNKNITKYLNKSLRNSSEFLVLKNKNIQGHAKRDFYSDNWGHDLILELTTNQDDFINKYCVKTLKKGNTAHVYLIEYLNRKVVIKKYLSKAKGKLNKLFNLVKYLFVTPRYIKSWLNANLLAGLNIATPCPLACFKLADESFFIMDYVGSVNDNNKDYKFDSLHDILNNKLVNIDVKKDIFVKLNNLLAKLKYLKIVHNDFKTVNLGYTNNKLIILDLDAMQRYNSKYYNNQKDITRLKKCFTDNSVLIELFEQYINK